MCSFINKKRPQNPVICFVITYIKYLSFSISTFSAVYPIVTNMGSLSFFFLSIFSIPFVLGSHVFVQTLQQYEKVTN